jgi:thioredoxin-related protein
MRILVIFTTMLFFVATSTAGGKEKFTWMTFSEGLAHAKKSGKKVMVDVYTDWCGWCKKMDRDTYEDQTVSEYLGRYYVSIRLNAESAKTILYQAKSYTEQELAAAFGIRGYPSIIFLAYDGEPITVYPGYADASTFTTVLSYIAEEHYKTTAFQDYARARK